MQKVNIICFGNLKEKYWRDAVAEYSKRLGAFCAFQVVELPESRLPSEPSEKEITAALAKEAAGLEKYLGAKGAYNIALCIEGRAVSSEALSERLADAGAKGFGAVNLYIGSSYGLAESVKERCQFRLSMSPMTFPHQLARVMLCEQLYRAYSISSHGKYHK